MEKNQFLGHQCLGTHIAGPVSKHINTKHQNQCSFPCHIDSSIKVMYLHLIVRRKKYTIIRIKFTLHIHIKDIKMTFLFFIFLFFLQCLNRETLWKRFGKKVSFFPIINFADKTIFNFHSFNKINDFVTTQSSNIAYYPFFLNP